MIPTRAVCGYRLAAAVFLAASVAPHAPWACGETPAAGSSTPQPVNVPSHVLAAPQLPSAPVWASVPEANAAIIPRPDVVRLPDTQEAPAIALEDEPGVGSLLAPIPERRWYGSLEFLYWWTRGQSVPPLLTSSPLGTPVTSAGVLGAATTTTVFGNDDLRSQGAPGGRFRLGRLMDACGCNIWEIEYLELAGDVDHYAYASPGDFDILARPFFNTQTMAQDVELVGYPGIVDGVFEAGVTLDLHGWGTWWRSNVLCLCGTSPCALDQPASCGGMLARLDMIVGYRNLDLDESVQLTERLVSTDPGGLIAVDTTFAIQDRFRTENNFDGLDLGVRAEWLHNRWGLAPVVKFAMGSLRQQIDISGSTDIVAPDGSSAAHAGGLLALASNSGRVERDHFAVVPEVGVQSFYQLNDSVRCVVGYSLIAIPGVVRPGGIIDLSLDPAQLPPPTASGTRSVLLVEEDDYWVQGINAGVELRF